MSTASTIDRTPARLDADRANPAAPLTRIVSHVDPMRRHHGGLGSDPALEVIATGARTPLTPAPVAPHDPHEPTDHVIPDGGTFRVYGHGGVDVHVGDGDWTCITTSPAECAALIGILRIAIARGERMSRADMGAT